MAPKTAIDPREAVSAEVRRVATLLLDRVSMNLSPDSHRSESEIHEARKALKRLRALTRLVKGSISKSAFRSANRSCRDAKNSLSGLRDAQVRINTLATLRGRGKSEEILKSQSAVALKRLEAGLTEASATPEDLRSLAGSVVERVLVEREGMQNWDLPDGFEAFAEGLAETYLRGRRLLKEMGDKPTVKEAHELRKHVKDLLYEVEFLNRAWPRPMTALGKELDVLSDLLGDDHDLALLEEAIRDLPVPAVRKRIQRRSLRLRIRSVRLASKIYSVRTKDFVRCLDRAWEAERTR